MRKKLGRHQSFVSDIEQGVIRLDLVQLRDLCRILDMDFVKFVRKFEFALAQVKNT